MNKQQFWQLIEQSGKQKGQIEWLTETLAQKRPRRLLNFTSICVHTSRKAANLDSVSLY